MSTPRRRHAAWSLALAVLAFGAVSRAEGYRTSLGTGDDVLPVVVVTGTPYEMGRAFGQLMRPEATALLTGFLARARAGDATTYSDAQLDAAWEALAPHTNPHVHLRLRDYLDFAKKPAGAILATAP